MNLPSNLSKPNVKPSGFRKSALAVAVTSILAVSGMNVAHAQTVTISAPQTISEDTLSTSSSDVLETSTVSIEGVFDIDGSAIGQIDNDFVVIESAGSITLNNSENHGVLLMHLSRAEKAKEVVVDSTSNTSNTSGSSSYEVDPGESFIDIATDSQSRILNNSVTNDGLISVTGGSKTDGGSISGVRVQADAQEAVVDGGDGHGASLLISSEASHTISATPSTSSVNVDGSSKITVNTLNTLRHDADTEVQNNLVTNNSVISIDNTLGNASAYGLDLVSTAESETTLDYDVSAYSYANSATYSGEDYSNLTGDADSLARNVYNVFATGQVADSTASMSNNLVTNAGSITVDGVDSLVGMRLIAETEADSDVLLTASADAQAYATSDSDDVMYADANAYAEISATVTSLRAFGESLTDNNSVTNSGDLSVTGSSIEITGVAFLADSDIDVDVTLDTHAEADYSETRNGFYNPDANAVAESHIGLVITEATASSTGHVRNNTFVNSPDAMISVEGTSDVVGLRVQSIADAKLALTNTETVSGNGARYVDNYLAIGDVEVSATVTVSNNTVSNAGEIQALGTGYVAGMRFFGDARARLVASDDSSFDFFSDMSADDVVLGAAATVVDNEINNSGSIIVDGGSRDAAGIELLANAASLHDYSYDFSSDLSIDGVYTDNALAAIRDNIINNSGIIAVDGGAGEDVDGIRLAAMTSTLSGNTVELVTGNTIANTGLIYAMDDGVSLVADGESADGIISNTISNTYPGRIVARDIGITINDDGTADVARSNVVNNSGLIVSDNHSPKDGDSMSLNGSSLIKSTPFAFNSGVTTTNVGTAIQILGEAGEDSNNVNLDAPSYIAGQFLFDRASNVNVDLTSGVSHSVRWVFDDSDASSGAEAFSTNGTVLWFTNDANFAGEDNDGDVDALNGVDDIFATIDPTAFAAAPNMLADLSGMASHMAHDGLDRTGNERNGVWVSVRGVSMDYEGDGLATMDQDVRTQGFAVGYTRDLGENTDVRLGLMAGYSKQNLDVGSFYGDVYSQSFENESKGAFLGVHGKGMVGDVEVGLGIAGGRQDHEDRRFVNDNLQWWGISYADSEYDSHWYAPELSLALPFAASETFTVKPNLNARYMVQKFDRYTETGSNSNATVDNHTVKTSEMSAGFDLIKQFTNGSVTTRFGYLQRNLEGDDDVRVTMIGDTNNVPYFTEDLGTGYVGISFRALVDTAYLEIDGNYMTDGDNKGGSLGAKLNVKF